MENPADKIVSMITSPYQYTPNPFRSEDSEESSENWDTSPKNPAQHKSTHDSDLYHPPKSVHPPVDSAFHSIQVLGNVSTLHDDELIEKSKEHVTTGHIDPSLFSQILNRWIRDRESLAFLRRSESRHIEEEKKRKDSERLAKIERDMLDAEEEEMRTKRKQEKDAEFDKYIRESKMISKLQEELSTLRSKHALVDIQLKSARRNEANLTKEKDKLRELVADLRDKLSDSTRKISEITKRKKEKDAEFDKYIRESKMISKLQEELSTLRSKHALVDIQLKSARRNEANLTKEKDKLRELVADLRDKLSDSTRKISEMSLEFSKISGDKERIAARSDMIEHKMIEKDSMHRKTLERLSGIISDERDEIFQLHELISTLEDTNRELQIHIEQKEREVAETKKLMKIQQGSIDW
ncbi:hypothetical protein ADUPG1_007893 [Aduncisulcus paluster]|uniref:Uncharacterized protein n=1 Tax=Aduncisulcus paluster TaxID=2918883 RepID=A0ABQ5KQ11_9EUKA|nr:hypothetical protein ADUPG1_007893 [Aduncisulcus paluster]